MLRVPAIFLCLTYSIFLEFVQVSEDSSAPHGIDGGQSVVPRLVKGMVCRAPHCRTHMPDTLGEMTRRGLGSARDF